MAESNEPVELAEDSTETEITSEADQADPQEEETSKEDAEQEAEPEIPEGLKKKLEAQERKLAKQAFELREQRRREERYLRMLEEKNQGSKAPKIDDFESLDDYMDARFKYLQEANQPQVEDVDIDVSTQIQDLYFEGSSKYEDFAEVVGGNAPITEDMRDAIFELDADKQVEVAYFLGKNIKETARIARLSPRRQALEIGKLEAKLSTPKSSTRQPSKAPEPIKPVSGKKTASDEIGEEEDFESFLKKRNKQLGR